MKGKVMGLVVVALFLVSLLPASLAATPGTGPAGLFNNAGSSIGIEVEATGSAPRIYMDPNTRILLHNYANGNVELVERENNYAFQGEQIVWDVVVWDKNGVEDIADVDVSAGTEEDDGSNDIEVECDANGRTDAPGAYGAYDDEGNALAWDVETMRWYTCIFTVETPEADNMHGEMWIVARVIDQDDNVDTVEEDSFFFLNPEIALAVSDESVVFRAADGGAVEPGMRVYSNTFLVESAVEDDSSVMLEVSISGEDFFDPVSSHAKCPVSNVLALTNFAYFATSGDYSTLTNAGSDAEGYDLVPYETGDINDRQFLIDDPNPADAFRPQVLMEGEEYAITLRLDMPRPCKGNFVDGEIFFWGRAI